MKDALSNHLVRSMKMATVISATYMMSKLPRSDSAGV
jgi:hypothetical protein